MTSRSAHVVLLSVRSPHVERILAGTKTVEFRRRPWSVPDGTRVLLYGSREQRAILGSVVVASTEVGSKTEMWEAHGVSSGLTRQEYRDYFAGASVAVAIKIAEATVLPDPLQLSELRRRSPGFHVPQSYRYVHPAELRVILNGERTALLGS